MEKDLKMLELPGTPEERKEYIKKELFLHNPAVRQAINIGDVANMTWEQTMEYLVCYLANENKLLREQVLDSTQKGFGGV